MIDLKGMIGMVDEFQPKSDKGGELKFFSELPQADNESNHDFETALLSLMGLKVIIGDMLPQKFQSAAEKSNLLPGENLSRSLLLTQSGDELNLFAQQNPDGTAINLNPFSLEQVKEEFVDFFLLRGLNPEENIFFAPDGLSGDLKKILSRKEGLLGNFEALHNQRQEIPVNLGEIKNIAPEKVFERNLIDQIRDKIGFFFKADRERMTIKLEPPSLGQLKLEIILKENNRVAASITADYQIVKEVLENNLSLLNYSLVRQGLQVEELNVFLNAASSRSSGREKGNFLRKEKDGSAGSWQVNNALKQDRYTGLRNRDLTLDIFI